MKSLKQKTIAIFAMLLLCMALYAAGAASSYADTDSAEAETTTEQETEPGISPQHDMNNLGGGRN